MKKPFRVLSLDGGGSKGFYTIGVLKEIEDRYGALHKFFDLIYGTSTGSVIGSLIALGYNVDDIYSLYETYIPPIMDRIRPTIKSRQLERAVGYVFGNKHFCDVKTKLGIITTEWTPGRLQRCVIFKSSDAISMTHTQPFVPGFGCTIADVVQASCSAYPLFLKKPLSLDGDTGRLFVDGGYSYNNPTVLAIGAAQKIVNPTDIRLVSIGVGFYTMPFKIPLVMSMLDTSTNNIEIERQTMYDHIPAVRIDHAFPQMSVSLISSNMRKLRQLYQYGRESFNEQEFEQNILI